MRNKFVVFLFLMIFVAPVAGEAFVPESPYLLYLVAKKIKRPVGLEVYQSLKRLDYTDASNGYIPEDERLVYAFPKGLRIEKVGSENADFSVETSDEFIRVLENRVVSRSKQIADHYTDMMLYRDPETLLGQLALSGIDIEAVQLTRFRDTFCYLVGSLEGSGLWVEKDTFFPPEIPDS